MLRPRELFYKIIWRHSMDIKPVRRPIQRPQTHTPGQVRPPSVQQPSMQGRSLQPQPFRPQPRPIVEPTPTQPPIIPVPPAYQSTSMPTPPRKKGSKKKKLLIIIASILALIIITVSGLWVWYQTQLTPVDAENKNKVQVVIAPGTPDSIAETLHEKGVIRNQDVFLWYTRFSGVQNNLQAGTYLLSPSDSMAQIVDHLKKGSVDDTFSITFYPGATLVDNVTSPEKRIDVTSVLKRAGYGDEEISTALKKTYDHPLFQDKPSTADLEGYIFGETYEFASGTKVETILTRTFDEFYKYVTNENLIALYKQQNLTLYQGITLASIVQRESGGDDKAQIAQVFYTRLKMGMQLGSDVTYQYIADKTGVPRSTTLNSPYNTRESVGLPPGPIATPGLSALKAVASPAPGNYLYFLSGDDHVTYYATTLEGHEANIRDHCKVKCQII